MLLMRAGAPAGDSGPTGRVRGVVLAICHLDHSRGNPCHDGPRSAAFRRRGRAGGRIPSDGLVNGRGPLRRSHGSPRVHLSAVRA